MRRLKRYVVNAGVVGTLATLLMTVGVVFCIRKDVGTGLWVWTVPAFMGPALLIYFLRGVLVAHMEVAGPIIHYTAVVAAAGFALSRPFLPSDEAWFRISVAAFLGVFMGCYFWMTSDPRIVLRRH